MPMIVRFSIEGDDQVFRTILRVGERASDMTPAFEKLHNSFLGIERRQFDTEGLSGSGGWAPLKPKTLMAKRSKHLDPRILRATDRLRQSLTNKSGRDHVARTSPDGFFFGTSVPYAKYHQHGTEKMPQRRPVELTEKQRRAWMRTLQKYLVTGVATESDA